MDKVRTFFENYVRVNDHDWNLIQDCFERKEYSRSQIILHEGDVCRYFYFLECGLIRFFCTIDGNDVTKTFALAPYCFTAKISFRKQSPSQEGIQALDDAVVWRTSFEQYKKLEQINSWNVFMRKILNEIQEFSDEFYMEVRTMTAEDRYKNLLAKYPASLIQKIPLKHLSSFLGIAPQSLSRIRKKLLSER